MYSQYLHSDSFSPIEQETPPPKHQNTEPDANPSLTESTSSGLSKAFSSLSRMFKIEQLDTGDILLFLIILFLFLEGDNLELVITLGLMLLLGLGED